MLLLLALGAGCVSATPGAANTNSGPTPLYAAASKGHEAVVAAPWRQDRFAISFWVDPVVPPERFDAEYVHDHVLCVKKVRVDRTPC